jgi:hypothetical protein
MKASTRSVIVLAALLVAAGAVYLVTRRSPPDPVEAPARLWEVEMLDLNRVSIALPRQGLAQVWVKHEDKHWYFDEPDGRRVSDGRWGGGIPAILSGPRPSRAIARDVSDGLMEVYGLSPPRMTIRLETARGQEVALDVGDATPTGRDHYVRLVDSRDVYTVDYTWYDVLERLVTEPPYEAPGA